MGQDTSRNVQQTSLIKMNQYNPSFEIIDAIPDYAAYQTLKTKVIGETYDVSAAKRGLENTDFAVHAMDGGKLVGFARVISDRGLWYYLTEETIDTEHPEPDQIRTAMIKQLVDHFYKVSPPGGYMMAMSDKPDLYQTGGMKLLDPPERGFWVQQTDEPNPFPKPSDDLGPGYDVIYEMVDAETFLKFREIGKLGKKDLAATHVSVERTPFAVQVLYEGECVAFCRTMHDGGLCYHMADGVVLPDHQASGIGKFFVSRQIYEFFKMAPTGAHYLAFTWAGEFALKSGFEELPENYVGLWAWQPFDAT
ncbi:MAG: hypothetical protein ABJK39_13230 [Hyphomicrobiales bacterium]